MKMILCAVIALNFAAAIGFALSGSGMLAAFNAGAFMFSYLLNFAEYKA